MRDIAQIGSVLGREFNYRLLAEVSGMPAERLRTGLAQLVAAELVFAHGQPPHAVYSFKHALVQDVTYESMLRSRCSALHARAATAMVETFPEIAETQPELVAMHLGRSGQVERAIEYLLRAGRRESNGRQTPRRSVSFGMRSTCCRHCRRARSGRRARCRWRWRWARQ